VSPLVDGSARRDARWEALVPLALVFLCSCGPSFDRDAKRVLVIGMDGLDHRLVERMMNEGKLPNFARLRDLGGFRPLETSIPPESPVAWSNFITGMDPGGHGVKDFFVLDPAVQTADGLRDSVTVTEGETKSLRLFGCEIPISGPTPENIRRGRAFWQVLEEHEVPAVVNRIPANFPPVETAQRTISGMGTPSLNGDVESYTLFTDNLPPNRYEMQGGAVKEVFPSDGRVKASLPGPPGMCGDGEEVETEFVVYYDTRSEAAKIVVGEETVVVNAGEWSRWVPVSFELFPYVVSIDGICRFLLQEVAPDFRLYASSVQIDPRSPATAISTPSSYARDLYERVGFYHTKGLPMEFRALDDGALRLPDFVSQMEELRREEFRILTHELDRFDAGVLFCYFSHTDLPVHSLWNLIDPTSPSYDPDLSARYGGTIEEIYRGADETLGDVLGWLEDHPDVLLLVLSDHGMASFNRAVHLNTWLYENGYLALREGVEPGPGVGILAESVDWSKTRAYGFGFAGIFVNLQGRERKGIVSPEAAGDLMEQLRRELEEFTDPDTGEPVFKRIYRADEVYHGPAADEGPDVMVGTFRGYRVSDESAKGEVPAAVVVDNLAPWSGDHSMAHDEVPGVLFSNRPIAEGTPALYDVTATILAVYGIDPLPDMLGKSVF